jgi:hypothetical protein
MEGQHMVTAELSGFRRGGPRALGRAWASGVCTLALTLITLFAALAAAIDPALAGATRPHPTLRPTAGEVISILITNARVCALPVLLSLFGFQHRRLSRRLGDALTGLVLAGNAVLVGVELGRWQTRILPYLPHLPVEWLAVGAAAGIWAHARTTPEPGEHRGLVIHAGAVAVLLAAAAVVEVLLTPHVVPAPPMTPGHHAPARETLVPGGADRSADRGWSG